MKQLFFAILTAFICTHIFSMDLGGHRITRKNCTLTHKDGKIHLTPAAHALVKHAHSFFTKRNKPESAKRAAHLWEKITDLQNKGLVIINPHSDETDRKKRKSRSDRIEKNKRRKRSTRNSTLRDNIVFNKSRPYQMKQGRETFLLNTLRELQDKVSPAIMKSFVDTIRSKEPCAQLNIWKDLHQQNLMNFDGFLVEDFANMIRNQTQFSGIDY